MTKTTMNNEIQEKHAKASSGMAMLLLSFVLMIGATVIFVLGLVYYSHSGLIVTCSSILFAVGLIVGILLLCGLKILKPKEAYALTLFGDYSGTLRGPGFFFVNPFSSAINTASTDTTSGIINVELSKEGEPSASINAKSKKISLKTMTLNNDKQKINDLLGNPVIIGVVVTWRVIDTAKAVFNVENYTEFLSIQCDSALRDTVRLYPYDISGEESDNEKSLRGSSQEIAEKIKVELQSKVDDAGLEILEARITNLAYAPEIAAAMLQRQQASAVVDARQMIVDGAVGMVEMALSKLSEKEIVQLDEERKAAMVSNLLVVLCGSKDAQPIVNSGSLY